MNKIVTTLKQKNMSAGFIYFYVHFITELVCFFSLKRIIGDSIVLWLSPLIYDMLAFVPQSIIGYCKDKHPEFKPGIIGIILLIIGIFNFITNIIPINYISIIIIAIGNAFMHIEGAEVTLRCSEGKMSHAAIFVSGGSFGVLAGKLMGSTSLSMWYLIPLILSMIPFCLLGERYVKKYNKLTKFNYHNKSIDPLIVILLATFVVSMRGYAGYGIPTSWNKSVIETIILFSFMGLGKALGGVFIDSFGMRKTALLSVLLSIPFLILGDKIMVISLIGVMLFSMTMAVTLGLIVSVLKTSPGLAFGYTTIGLFLGSVPMFFVKINSLLINGIVITTLSIICYIFLNIVIRKED